ncbi:hypothetical protein [Nocardia ignorata]|uniref:Uncharacterized protein n=1 Tax=Nocardia ignorata TaxID=145285 RepID=A0A4R6NZQ5_NOCIG|nr:hypothetical protein [Nocardia ignorata]TDP29828.1 hypothetical protein DFR75_11296 [Nocardia ignorata]
MNPDPDQSIWDSELEPLAIAIYRALNSLGSEASWPVEPASVQARYLAAARDARAHVTNTNSQEN